MPKLLGDLPIYRQVSTRFTAVLRGRAKTRKDRVLSILKLGAEEMPFAPRDLCTFLEFRIHTADQAAKRNAWVVGRMYNGLTGQSACYVPLYGTHLRQCLALVLGQIPDGIVPRGKYELRLDYVQRAYDALKRQLDA